MTDIKRGELTLTDEHDYEAKKKRPFHAIEVDHLDSFGKEDEENPRAHIAPMLWSGHWPYTLDTNSHFQDALLSPLASKDTLSPWLITDSSESSPTTSSLMSQSHNLIEQLPASLGETYNNTNGKGDDDGDVDMGIDMKSAQFSSASLASAVGSTSTSVELNGSSALPQTTDASSFGTRIAPRTSNRSTQKMTRFFMGFRNDCELCRLQAPGHYSHILR